MIDIYITKFVDLELIKYKHLLSNYRLNKNEKNINRNIFIELFLIKVISFYQKTSIPLMIEKDIKGKIKINDFKYHFNITHSKEYLAIAISNAEIGIDIEYNDQKHLKISKKIFSNSMFLTYNKLDEKEKIDFFYCIWTIRESFLKNIGEGIILNLNDINIEFIEEKAFLKSKVFYQDELNSYTKKIDNYHLSISTVLDEYPQIFEISYKDFIS